MHHPDRPAHFGIRNERYKLAFFYGQGLGKKGTSKENSEPSWEFYDLHEDPNELHNAVADEKYANVILEMKQELIKERKKYNDLDTDSPVMKDILTNAMLK